MDRHRSSTASGTTSDEGPPLETPDSEGRLQYEVSRFFETASFARYLSMPLHGIFLFRKANGFSGFLHDHFDDLNHASGDLLDIYYESRDLQDDRSGYSLIRRLPFLEKASSLPALVLWSNRLAEAQSIPLRGLEPDDYMSVIEEIVQRVRKRYPLDRIGAEVRGLG
jgi:hypothetical protein